MNIQWRVIENGRPRTLVPDSTTIINVNHSAVINGESQFSYLANNFDTIKRIQSEKMPINALLRFLQEKTLYFLQYDGNLL